jgi:hypothetical protein
MFFKIKHISPSVLVDLLRHVEGDRLRVINIATPKIVDSAESLSNFRVDRTTDHLFINSLPSLAPAC